MKSKGGQSYNVHIKPQNQSKTNIKETLFRAIGSWIEYCLLNVVRYTYQKESK